MTERFQPSGLRIVIVALSAIFVTGQAALAQPPMGPPGAEEGGMPWQVAVLFTANWVLAAVAVALLSRPSKRSEKPKKVEEPAA